MPSGAAERREADPGLGLVLRGLGLGLWGLGGSGFRVLVFRVEGLRVLVFGFGGFRVCGLEVSGLGL